MRNRILIFLFLADLKVAGAIRANITVQVSQTHYDIIYKTTYYDYTIGESGWKYVISELILILDIYASDSGLHTIEGLVELVGKRFSFYT